MSVKDKEEEEKYGREIFALQCKSDTCKRREGRKEGGSVGRISDFSPVLRKLADWWQNCEPKFSIRGASVSPSELRMLAPSQSLGKNIASVKKTVVVQNVR